MRRPASSGLAWAVALAATAAGGGLLQAQSSQGLLGEYYNFGTGGSPQPPPGSPAGNTFTANPVHRRIDATVNFNFTMNPGPAPGVNADHFVVAWSGFVTPTASGNHTFGTISDDGVRLWIDGVLVRDDWADQGAAGAPEMQTVAALNLTAGVAYSLRMEVYDNAGEQAARLYWQPPGAAAPVVIPSSVLSPPPGPNPPTVTAVQNGFNVQVDVSWTNLGANITYDLDRDTGAGYQNVLSGTTQTTYTDTTNLNFGMTVCYRVRAIESGVLVGTYSAPACVTLQFPPPRTNDHEEGLLEDRCACGSSIPAAPPFPAAGVLLAALLLARRRR